MDFMTLLPILFENVLIPLLTLVVVPFIVQFLKAKSEEIQVKTDNDAIDKYIQMITETVINCVLTTNQTYVESLKAQGAFDAEAQKIAFQKTYDAVMAVLSEDAIEFIGSMFGDVTVYLTNLIESTVNANK